MADFLRQAQQLKKLVDKHEKERAVNKHRRRDGPRDCFCELQEFEKTLNSERKADILRMQEQLQEIRNDVHRFQEFLTDVMPTSSSIEKLKDVMNEVENAISTFKEHQYKGFETLLHEESTCWQGICAIDKRIDSWTLAVKKDSPFHQISRSKSVMSKQRRQEFPAEVQALETFLQQTGGTHGGWDQCDHQSFLKVWTKHWGKPSYRSEVQLYLSGKTEEDIRLHEDWHLEVCRLQEKKKEAIQKWRSERQKERQACVQHEQQSREAERTEQEAVRLKKETARKKVTFRLEAWRKQWRQQGEQQEEQKLKEEELRHKRLMEEGLRQQKAKRIVKARIKDRKEEEELRKLEEEVQDDRRKLAAEYVKRFQARDLHKFGRKPQEKPVKEEKVEQGKKPARVKAQVESHISRDPSKHTKPIKRWEELKSFGPQEAESSVT